MRHVIKIQNGKILPNWRQNKVEVSGKSEDIERFVNLVGDDFDFRKIIPMPEELYDTLYPVATEGPNANMIPERQKELMDKYRGADNWYEWALFNWTTPSLAKKLRVVVKRKDFFKFEFFTEESPPIRICRKIKEIFPDLCISWFFNVPDKEVSGYLDNIFKGRKKQDKENKTQ